MVLAAVGVGNAERAGRGQGAVFGHRAGRRPGDGGGVIAAGDGDVDGLVSVPSTDLTVSVSVTCWPSMSGSAIERLGPLLAPATQVVDWEGEMACCRSATCGWLGNAGRTLSTSANREVSRNAVCHDAPFRWQRSWPK